MIYDRLYVKITPNTIDLNFKSRITAVGGNSSSGKTFIANILALLSSREEFNNIEVYGISNANNINNILHAENKLIIVDNADIVLSDNIRNFINTNKTNQYLLFCRRYKGLSLSKNSHQIPEYADYTFKSTTPI